MKSLFPIIILVFGAWACSNSHITSSWKAETASTKNYKKIMVMGLISDPDKTIRERLEEHLAGDLNRLGYSTVTSTGEYGPTAFENLTEEEALKQLYEKGIDGVITVVLLDKTREGYYLAGGPRFYNYSDHPDNFWRYYNMMYGRLFTPGYYGISTKYFWESNFYDMKDGQLMYSAQSHSFDPASSEQLGHEYGLMIARDIVKKKVLHHTVARAYKAF